MKRTDTEQWMHHRQLPSELRESIRKYNQYKWVATRGVEEEDLLKGLPLDLRRDIKRHLCLELVRGVSLESEFLFVYKIILVASMTTSRFWLMTFEMIN